jgi:E3 ubiquitin-protein ligase DOA10
MKSDSSNSQVLGLILVVIGIVLIVFYFYKNSSVQNSGAVTNDNTATQEEQVRRINMMERQGQRQEQIEGLQVQEEHQRHKKHHSGTSSEEMAHIKTSMRDKMGESDSMMMDKLNLNESFTQDRDQFPKDTLNPDELLPSNNNSMWNQVNPSGEGTLKDRNFLQSGYHIGINTVGQTLRNANLQLRSEPPCPQVKVSPWMTSTIEPDVSRRPFEISGC